MIFNFLKSERILHLDAKHQELLNFFVQVLGHGDVMNDLLLINVKSILLRSGSNF